MSWRILARHKWITGTSITESANDGWRRYTATIRGYQNWRLYEGVPVPAIPALVVRAVRAIRDQIDADAEHCEALMASNQYSHNVRDLTMRTEMFEHSVSEAFDAFLANDQLDL